MHERDVGEDNVTLLIEPHDELALAIDDQGTWSKDKLETAIATGKEKMLRAAE